MGRTLFEDLDGEPLLYIVDPDPPYRRNNIGFAPPEARETYGTPRPSGSDQPVETCACCAVGEDAEAIAVDLDVFEEEESTWEAEVNPRS
jgi:hypothetical protein